MLPDERTRVLVVDDGARNGKLMELLIQAEGHPVDRGALKACLTEFLGNGKR